ncbi:MAG: alpha/beta fold hydrolase [Lautropia sp.]|nr:alpha/beta fold hydrolase [Lautropia sp.]
MRVPSNPVEHRSVDTRYGSLHLKVWPAAEGEAVRRPTVVLFHGLFGDSDVWAATALNLNRAGLNVLAFDLPGHGGSYARVATMADVVDCIREALLAGAWPSLVLVGHSFGAVVATRLAADPALGVKGLALLAPAGLGREVNNTFLEEVMAATDDRELAEALSYLTVKQQRVSSTYLRLMLKRIEAARPQLRALIDEAVGPDDGLQHNSIREDLPRLACPIVIIQGREDGVMPWRHVLNAPSEAALHLLADVGHMPHWEANGLTNRVLLQLVNSVEHG